MGGGDLILQHFQRGPPCKGFPFRDQDFPVCGFPFQEQVLSCMQFEEALQN